jgi:argininosuccinate lyase
MKTWEKEYKLNKKIEEFTVGNDYLIDKKLVKYDCNGSIAHVKMLKKIGIINDNEENKLIKTLKEIITLDKNDEFIIKQEDEDCHTAIENYLIKKLGNVGKKIHTARSRNDQVLTALRLYYKDELKIIIKLCENITNAFFKFKEKFGEIKIPGYTHMRKAMPSSINIWADSFIESMNDNIDLLKFILDLIDQSPLGAGTGYELPIKFDKKTTAKYLGFNKVQKNPLYTQNSRGKFESTILHGLSQIMFDLNKIASDLILFSMPEFGYFKLPSEFQTGSSIMPHKKNPDVFEIVRAKYGQIVSYEFQIKNIISNLISGYNRDLQLTKAPIIKGFDITKDSIDIMTLIINSLKVDKNRCESAMSEELFATEEVYKLVKKGFPFRDAYLQISKKYETNQ